MCSREHFIDTLIDFKEFSIAEISEILQQKKMTASMRAIMSQALDNIKDILDIEVIMYEIDEHRASEEYTEKKSMSPKPMGEYESEETCHCHQLPKVSAMPVSHA